MKLIISYGDNTLIISCVNVNESDVFMGRDTLENSCNFVQINKISFLLNLPS